MSGFLKSGHIWGITSDLPNLPNFSSTKHLYYIAVYMHIYDNHGKLLHKNSKSGGFMSTAHFYDACRPLETIFYISVHNVHIIIEHTTTTVHTCNEIIRTIVPS